MFQQLFLQFPFFLLLNRFFKTHIFYDRLKHPKVQQAFENFYTQKQTQNRFLLLLELVAYIPHVTTYQQPLHNLTIQTLDKTEEKAFRWFLFNYPKIFHFFYRYIAPQQRLFPRLWAFSILNGSTIGRYRIITDKDRGHTGDLNTNHDPPLFLFPRLTMKPTVATMQCQYRVPSVRTIVIHQSPVFGIVLVVLRFSPVFGFSCGFITGNNVSSSSSNVGIGLETLLMYWKEKGNEIPSFGLRDVLKRRFWRRFVMFFNRSSAYSLLRKKTHCVY